MYATIKLHKKVFNQQALNVPIARNVIVIVLVMDIISVVFVITTQILILTTADVDLPITLENKEINVYMKIKHA